MTEPMSEDDIKQAGLANCCPGYEPKGCWYRVEARDQERIVEIIRDHTWLVEIIRAGRGTLERQRVELEQNREDWKALRAENARVVAERDLLLLNPDNRIDGYRELAARCAALEERNDALRAENAKLRERVANLMVAIAPLRIDLPCKCDDDGECQYHAEMLHEVVLAARAALAACDEEP